MVQIFQSPTSFRMSWLLLTTLCFLSVQMSQGDDKQKRMSTAGKWHLFALPQLFNSNRQIEMIILTHGALPVKCRYQLLDKGQPLEPVDVELADTYSIVDITIYSYSEPKTILSSINVTSSEDISLFLYTGNKPTVGALIRILPVQYWGKEYFAVSMVNNPTIMITPSELNTKVIVKFLINYNVGNRTISTKEETHNLENFMTQSISLCEGDEAMSYTGTHIMADKKIGVFSGTCYTREIKVGCKEEKITITDIALENILPVEYFGLEFMTFTPNFNETEKQTDVMGEVIVIASKSNTRVTYMSGSSSSVSNLDVAGHSTRILNLEPQLIKSNFPVMATYVMYGSCEGSLGAPSLAVLIPSRLFSTYYEMSVRKVNIDKWSLVVIFKGDADSMFETSMGQVKAQEVQGVKGQASWSSGSIPLENSSYIYMSGFQPFGCYVLNIMNDEGSITYVDVLNNTEEMTTHAPKVMTSVVTLPPIQTTIQQKITTVQAVMTSGGCIMSLLIIPGDNIDNDCDGAVDEEVSNGKDDDGDGKVDEDLAQIIVSQTQLPQVTNYSTIKTETFSMSSEILVFNSTNARDAILEHSTSAPLKSTLYLVVGLPLLHIMYFLSAGFAAANLNIDEKASR